MTRRTVTLTAAAGLLAALALLLLAGAALDLVDAARGTTGDTAREVPLVFGIAFVLVSLAFGWGAWTLWRQRR